MHLDPPFRFVVAHHVLEPREIEIRCKLAVDPGKQILVERGRHSRGIGVSQLQLFHAFLEISREQQSSAYTEDRPHLAQKLISGRPVEISNRAAEKEKKDLFTLAPTRGHFL